MIKPFIARIITNLPGWRTNRRIIVLESDDWGSIRMPSKLIYEKCLKAGYPVDRTKYERYDSLLSGNDLDLLFDLLLSFRDNKGNHPIITANCVVANPDFEKIRKDNFRRYSFELITETFKRYPAHSNNFEKWQQGIAQKIFFPQFHAREHLNISLFMDSLIRGNIDSHFSFDMQMPGIISHGSKPGGNYYVEPTKYNTLEDKHDKLEIFLEGLDLFNKLFGYKSESIIPPNYTWSPDFNRSVLEKGVKYFQGIRKIRELFPDGRYIYHSYYLGKKNNLGQLYLVRNCFFEPSLKIPGVSDPVKQCLFDIGMAFAMKKPAIISSHRINFAGYIDPVNRDEGLKMLSQILTQALTKWPDIEFMTSSQLGKIIDGD